MATNAATCRRFEYIGGSSCKFWEVEVTGGDVVVRYGRIGTAGQTVTKTFAEGTAAAAHAAKLIGEKVKKGYAEKA
jgi:predicted DNA-binding WGR domain protein